MPLRHSAPIGRWAIAASLSLLASTAWANQPITKEATKGFNAGAIQQEQLDQERRLRNQPTQPEEPMLDKGESPATDDAKADDQGSQPDTPSDQPTKTFILTSIRFTPSDILSKDFQPIVQPRLNQPVTIDDLNTITEAITALYQQKGIFTASAILPPQRIENGVVVIQLVEGKLGQIRWATDDHYTDHDWASE